MENKVTQKVALFFYMIENMKTKNRVAKRNPVLVYEVGDVGIFETESGASFSTNG